MSGSERRDDLLESIDGDNRLDAELRDSLLSPALADRRIRALPAEEGARPGRVPRAALVLADPPRTCLEDRGAS